MTTKTPTDSHRRAHTPLLTTSEIFRALADKRRRYVLHYLSQQVGAVPLGELAEQLALWEDTPTREHYEQILTNLYHNHLPKLDDSGLIRYDIERETVLGLRTIDTVAPYLDLALVDDFH